MNRTIYLWGLMATLALLPGCSKDEDEGSLEPVVVTSSSTASGASVAAAPDLSNSPLVLKIISPDRTKAGVGFHTQPNGESALGVTSQNATRTTSIEIDGRKLPTTFGNPAFLSAIVPKEFYVKTGKHQIKLVDGKRVSNVLTLTIEP